MWSEKGNQSHLWHHCPTELPCRICSCRKYWIHIGVEFYSMPSFPYYSCFKKSTLQLGKVLNETLYYLWVFHDRHESKYHFSITKSTYLDHFTSVQITLLNKLEKKSHSSLISHITFREYPNYGFGLIYGEIGNWVSAQWYMKNKCSIQMAPPWFLVSMIA